MDQRITMVSGLNVHSPYAEYLQVVNYGIGGNYEPHFDHATVSIMCALQIESEIMINKCNVRLSL